MKEYYNDSTTGVFTSQKRSVRKEEKGLIGKVREEEITRRISAKNVAKK